MSNESKKTPPGKNSEASKKTFKKLNAKPVKGIGKKILPAKEQINENDGSEGLGGTNASAQEELPNLESSTRCKEALTRVPASYKLTDETIPEEKKNNENEEGPSLPAEAIQGTSSLDTLILKKKDSHQFCRICHEVGKSDSFISPCKCKGSLSLVHKWCLERWLAESDTNHCELCGFVYNVYRRPKYRLIPSLFLWAWNGAPLRERRLMMYDAVLFAIICPLILFISVFSFKVVESVITGDIIERLASFQTKVGVQLRSEDLQLIATLLARTFQMTLISLMITFDVGFISWSVMRFQYYIRRWYRWYRRNSHVILTGYPEISRNPLINESSSSANNIRSVSF
ncbi:hypothetical protein O3M35_010820 [Rhynocoris fuscipes]|uniref:RING-CH-type domain-containing protein n=1 Tax=Rhynocoris fuscipes TaxID=488301 RepID=A0AAW1D371_9HEMI